MTKIANFLFAFILAFVCADICHPQTYLQDVYSASLTASQKGSNNFALNNSKDSNTYAYTLPKVFSKNPEVAFALNSFDANRLNNFTVFISSIQINPSLINIIINTPCKSTEWSALSFNILLNARTDIQVGSYSFGAEANTNTIAIPLKRALSKTQNYVARAFISGLDLSGNGLTSFSIVGGIINNTHFPVTVNSSQTINIVSISYFLFNPKLIGFSAYGGTVNKPSLANVHYQSVFRSLGSLQNYIYGLTGFSFNSNLISIHSKIDSKFLLTINPGNNGVSSLALSYIIFGNSPKLACNSCKNTIINSNIDCVATCPINTALYTFSEGGKACIHCPSEANLIINSQATDCLCKSGFTLSNGICINSNSTNSFPEIHSDPMILSVKNSTPQSNIDDDTNQPYLAHKCSNPNSFWDGSRCSCLPKYYLIQGTCQPCSSSTFWNGQTCVSILYGGSHSKKSEKKSDDLNSNSETHNNPPHIVCNGANQYVRADNICGCIKGFYMNNGVCSEGLQCPQNSVRLSATSCECTAGYFNIDGFCSKCKKWFYYDQSKNQCQSACPANSVYNIAQQDCICTTGYYKKSSTECVTCPSGSNWVNGICITCPIYSQFVNGNCQCLTGYALTNGICQVSSSSSLGSSSSTLPGSFNYNGLMVSCPLFTKFDFNLKKCMCITGYTVNTNGICQDSCPNGIIQNGVCKLCPINSSPSNGICVCNSRYTKNNLGICTESCDPPSFLHQGNCVSCPSSSTWNQNTLQCVCNAGFVKNTYGICVTQCPVGSVLTNNICNCISGFYSTSANNAPPCATCSAGCLTCINGKTCSSCTTGFRLNNGACTAVVNCKKNQFLISDVCKDCTNNCESCIGPNQCTKCEQGYNWNIKTSTCLAQRIPNPFLNPFPISISSTVAINTNLIIKVIYTMTNSQRIRNIYTNIPTVKCIEVKNTVLCQRNNNLGTIIIVANISSNSGQLQKVFTNVPAINPTKDQHSNTNNLEIDKDKSKSSSQKSVVRPTL